MSVVSGIALVLQSQPIQLFVPTSALLRLINDTLSPFSGDTIAGKIF